MSAEKKASRQWQRFARKAKRIFRDALRLCVRRDWPNYESLVNRVNRRLDTLVAHTDWEDDDCRRLARRLLKTQRGLFLFLDRPEIPAENNRAEREIRPAAIARKNSFQNASQEGAEAQGILMTIHRTLKLRGQDPIETIVDALTIYTASDCLPPFPRPPDSVG